MPPACRSIVSPGTGGPLLGFSVFWAGGGLASPPEKSLAGAAERSTRLGGWKAVGVRGGGRVVGGREGICGSVEQVKHLRDRALGVPVAGVGWELGAELPPRGRWPDGVESGP